MNDNRLGGLALILGALSGIITLTFHPAGGSHHVSPAQFEVLIAVIVGVHVWRFAVCRFLLPARWHSRGESIRQCD